MALSREQVLHVASLARLELTDAEVTQLTQDLGRILVHIEMLNRADTNNVAPTLHLGVLAAPQREDTWTPGVSPETALEPAPRTLGGGFAVPAFVDE